MYAYSISSSTTLTICAVHDYTNFTFLPSHSSIENLLDPYDNFKNTLRSSIGFKRSFMPLPSRVFLWTLHFKAFGSYFGLVLNLINYWVKPNNYFGVNNRLCIHNPTIGYLCILLSLKKLFFIMFSTP